MNRLTFSERQRNERNMITFFWIIFTPFVVVVLCSIVNTILDNIIGNIDLINFWTVTMPLAIVSIWIVCKIRKMPKVKNQDDYTIRGDK